MFILCGLVMLPVVLAFSLTAGYFTGTGGPVLYTRVAFGSVVGFQTGWLLYLGRVTALAANSNKLVDYSALLLPVLADEIWRTLAIVCLFTFLISINVIGVRRGAATTNIFTILKLLPLLLFIGLGFSYIVKDSVLTASAPSYDSLAEGLLFIVYAFVGFEGAVVPAGESRNPKKDIPKALLLTVCLTTVLYFFIQAVCVAVLPNLRDSATPLADAAATLVGPLGALIMTLTGIVSIGGNLSAIVLAAPRMTYAMARDHTLPEMLGNVHRKYNTPAASIVLLGGLGLGLALSGTFVFLAIMSSLARMLGYLACVASLPIIANKLREPNLRRKYTEYAIAGLGLVLCIWLAAQAVAAAWLLTAVFVVVGFILYGITRFQQRKQENAEQQ